VIVTAKAAAGLFYGVQTLRQLLPPFVDFEAVRFEEGRSVAVPAVRISDRPRFRWRGAMLDVARHFFSVEDVKRYVDLISMYKLNHLHLHLADDQGWRIEIKSWPNLAVKGGVTEVGGGPGGYYTQAQYRKSSARARSPSRLPRDRHAGHNTAAAYADSPVTVSRASRQASTLFSALVNKFIDDVVRRSRRSPGLYFRRRRRGRNATPAHSAVHRAFRRFAVARQQMIGWDEIAPGRSREDDIAALAPDGSPAAAVKRVSGDHVGRQPAH
jgi:hexosaminidase